MHIVIYSYNYYPEIMGIPKTNTMLAEALVRAGNRVSVITAFPHYPFRRKFPGYGNGLFRREERNGVQIYRTYIYISNEDNFFKRVWHEASFIFCSVISFFKIKDADIVISVCPPLTGSLLAALFCRIRRIPMIIMIKDLLPDSAIFLGFIKNRAAIKVLRFVENLGYALADKIIVVSELFRENLIKKGVRPEKIVFLREFVDTNEIKPGPKNGKFCRKMNWDGRFVVLYSGNIGYSQGLEIVSEVAEILKDRRDILFVIAGEGTKKIYLEKAAERKKLTNLVIIPPVSDDEFGLMLNCADILLLTQRKEVFDINFPSKLGAYLASGKPVIASVNSENEVARIARETGAYKLVPAGDSRALADAVIELYTCDKYRDELGKKAVEYARENMSESRALANLTRVFAELKEDGR